MWRCRNGNFLEYTPRLAGVFEDFEAEFDFSGTAPKAARAFNTRSQRPAQETQGARWAKATSWESRRAGSSLNTRQQPYWGPTTGWRRRA